MGILPHSRSTFSFQYRILSSDFRSVVEKANKQKCDPLQYKIYSTMVKLRVITAILVFQLSHRIGSLPYVLFTLIYLACSATYTKLDHDLDIK